MSDVQRDAEARVRGIADEIKNLREDLARMGSIVEELVRRRANDAVDEVTRRAEKAWEDAGRMSDEAAKVLEANPVATIGGAFGLGILVGLLFGRR
ncbi:MAG: hypothetical protein KGO02_06720 [Alphaproteobacteria bacterium]|nr:hypothetical protein [Alphaproteobacteria bacterium]